MKPRGERRSWGQGGLAFLVLLFLALQTGLLCMPPPARAMIMTGDAQAHHHHQAPTAPTPAPGACCPSMHAPPPAPLSQPLLEDAPELPLLPAPLSSGLLPLCPAASPPMARPTADPPPLPHPVMPLRI